MSPERTHPILYRTRARNVFDHIKNRHYIAARYNHADVNEEPRILRDTNRFFLIGLYHFTANGDSKIREIGQEVREAMFNEQLKVTYKSVSPENENSGKGLFFRPGSGPDDQAELTVTPDIIKTAEDRPVELLAAMAGIFSVIRDLVNRQPSLDITDEAIELRSEETVVHFLKTVPREDRGNTDRGNSSPKTPLDIFGKPLHRNSNN